MKLQIIAAVSAFLLLLSGCNGKEDDAVTGIKFERGHGSVWGNQFYIEISDDEIVTARYIREGTGELVTEEHIPITDAQRQTIRTVAQQLPLEKERTQLWGKRKADGTEFRKLTLICGTKETVYRWPNTPEANQLEQLLESMVKNETEEIK